VALLLGLLLNFGGLVWGAATLHTQVDSNTDTIAAHGNAVLRNTSRIENHEARLQVKEAQYEETIRRLQRMEAKIDRLIEQMGD
jgi:hypothetical protein